MKELFHPARLAMAVSSALALSATEAAVITVDTLDDSQQAGECSLRSAIEAVNEQQAIYGCNAPDGDDSIEFAAGLEGTILLSQEEEGNRLVIYEAVSIIGPGAETLTIDGGGDDYSVFVVSGADVSISGLSVTGGYSPGAFVKYGGGIQVREAGYLDLSDCMIHGNVSSIGGGVAAREGSAAVISNCEIVDNYSSLSGGGIGVADSSVTLIDSVVSGNEGAEAGGGLYVTGLPFGGEDEPLAATAGQAVENQLVIIDSLISENTAPVGGGIAAGAPNDPEKGAIRARGNPDSFSPGRGQPAPNLVIEGATITANVAGVGGGIGLRGFVEEDPDLGFYGIMNDVVIRDTSISGNTADGVGGGLAAYYSNAFIETAVIDNNQAVYGGGIANRGTYQPGGSISLAGRGGGGGGEMPGLGEIVLIESSLSGNHIEPAAGPLGLGEYAYGGGLFNSQGLVYLVDSDISGNTGAMLGGGVHNIDGATAVAYSTISANEGGGMASTNGANGFAIGSRIENNSAAPVGGMNCESGSYCLAKYSSITGNQGSVVGGLGTGVSDGFRTHSEALDSEQDAPQGGAGGYLSELVIVNSTVSGNSGGYVGGAVGQALTLVHSTVADNSSLGPLRDNSRGIGLAPAGGVFAFGDYSVIDHSIIASNSGNGEPDDLATVGNPIPMNFSLIGVDEGFDHAGDDNLFDVEPLLEPLATNNSPYSLTHAFGDDSPAFEAGDPNIDTSLSQDQRLGGFPRVFGIIDIGAYERFPDRLFQDRFEAP